MKADITIPPEALEAARRTYELKVRFLDCDPLSAACLAMLKHWPGMWRINAVDFEGKIILPLPKEGFTEGHCEHRKSPGGCQLHNLQCGYPDCDRRGRKHE